MVDPRRQRRRRCPRCERLTGLGSCCGIDLTVRRRPWRMDNDKLRLVHVLKARKGLDEDSYRARLSAVGVTSSKQLSRTKFREFLRGLAALPDAAGRRPRQAPDTRRARG